MEGFLFFSKLWRMGVRDLPHPCPLPKERVRENAVGMGGIGLRVRRAVERCKTRKNFIESPATLTALPLPGGEGRGEGGRWLHSFSHRFHRGLVLLWLTLCAVARAATADTFNTAYIAEFLTENKGGLQDEDGERHGWIEIHNGGSTTVNLAGWFLTDTGSNLTKWAFPNVALLADKPMVVFVSGKNRANNLAPLHTNFRLAKEGGYLALVNRATNVVSEFAPSYPAQKADVSFGSVRGEPKLRGAFPRPTPGKANASSGPGFAPEVKFSRAGGNFTEPFAVELSCRTNGAVIRFTLDGTLPVSTSMVYSAALLITNTTQLRARAFKEGLLPGPPHSEAYLNLFTNVLEFTSTLPLLVMDTFGRDMPVSDSRTFVHLSLHEPVNGKASLTNAPTLTTRAGYRVRGSTSAGMPQLGFAMEFIDEFNQEKNLALLGLPADSDWILYAPNSFDPVMIHNPFAHQLSRDLGHWSPRTRFVEVFLVRGAGRVRDTYYHGVYVLEEKIKISKNRVDIERVGAEDVKPPKVTGGYLFKFDRLGPNEGGLNAGGAGMVYVEPKEPAIMVPQRAPQREYLTKYFTDFQRALDGPNWKDATRGYRAFFDVEAGIDFHVLEVLSGNVDAIVLSTYFYKPRNGKVTYGPHWDFDRALGSTDGRDDNPRQWNTGPFFSGAWWPRMFSDVDFWQQWVDRWQELRRTHFSVTNLHGLVDRLTGELREAQPREYKRWGFQPRGGSYQAEIDHMKRWLASRVDFIDGQLVQPPHFDKQGEGGALLTLTAATNATIYFTLDGTDPRLAQGVISSNAVAYSGPIPIKADAKIVARAHNAKQRQSGGPPASTPWSGPVKASYSVGR